MKGPKLDHLLNLKGSGSETLIYPKNPTNFKLFTSWLAHGWQEESKLDGTKPSLFVFFYIMFLCWGFSTIKWK